MLFFRNIPHHLDAIGVVVIAVALFVGALLGLARAVDDLARDQQEVLIRNALNASVREAEQRVLSISEWDEAVRNLGNRFNASWADQNVGKYFLSTHKMAPSFVLGGDDRPIYRMHDPAHPEWTDYSLFAKDAAPLIAKVRARERRRGRFRVQIGTAGPISRPIQAGGIFRTRQGTFLVAAGLVQPDFGKALPRGPRAPILVVGRKIDNPFLRALGDELAIPTLALSQVDSRGASMTVVDSRGRPALRLSWIAFRPGAQFAGVALVPILAGVLLLLALYFRGRSTATKLKQTISELAAARDAALHANRVKNEFLANMSHELRTPLNAILGFSEMLRADVFAPKRAEYADIIHRSGSQLLSLVNDLLDLARIEAGRFTLRPEIVDLDALIAECLTAVAPRCMEKGVRIAPAYQSAPPLLYADHRALQQILLNLLSNAVKFTDEGKHIRVFVQAPSQSGIDFGVEDEGAGIAEEDQVGVFERFGLGRHDLVRNEEGAGLGLPIVKGLVEAHGGSIALASRVGEGTRVTVHLPPSCLAPEQPLHAAA